MGVDRSLSDHYPSVLIHGIQYHYGRDSRDGSYLVENAREPNDYWCFQRKQDLIAFLANLPGSAARDRETRYPDWHQVSGGRRDAYIEEDLARLRVLAKHKMLSETAQQFNMDLAGERGP